MGDPQTPYRGFAPVLHWGTSVPQTAPRRILGPLLVFPGSALDDLLYTGRNHGFTVQRTSSSVTSWNRRTDVEL